MFGYLRFILAVFVLCSHSKITFFYVHQGWVAVFAFYILAGIVSTKLFYQVHQNNIKIYLKDRFLRIYPMAIFWLVIAFVSIAALTPNELSLSSLKFIYAITLIPLSYFSYINVQTLPNEIPGLDFVLPPFFSVGLEVQIYMLLAILFTVNKFWLIRTVAIISFIQYAIVIFFPIFKETQDAVNFSYTMFFSVFWVFYIGILIYYKKNKEVLLWWVILTSLLALQFATRHGLGSSPHTLIGVVIFIPIIAAMANVDVKLKFNNFFGSMSYIVYCNHYLVVFLSEKLYKTILPWYLTLAISMIIGLVSYWLIELPLNKKRGLKK
ncbi:acyltransferase family protein [Campylobacter sp. MOP51]|uniref:acyltransferase family protein n=1 Tax=Campylobacter canis TaxID=3378588 RepID=UPI003C67403C